jgi:transglutaminase-like putative cysteine protease
MTVTTQPSDRITGTGSPAPVAPVLDGQAARLTLRALTASALGALPLLQLLSDTDWLIQAWIAMAIVIVPATLIRLGRAPSALHLLPGIVLLIGYLTRVYLPTHAWLGVVPTTSSWTDLRTLTTALGVTVRDSAAPVDSTAPIRLYLSIGLAALAIVIDLLVVELHRPALAGVPLLLVFTLAGAVPRDPVNWIWFSLAGAGYLLILSSRSTDELRSWGRVVARPERTSGSRRLSSALSGRRIGFAAIVAAVLVPFVLPLASVNLLADALHNGQVGVGGNGKGKTGVVIDPLASLRGQLTRSSPIDLFSVDVTGAGAKNAFYLRTAVLETYNGNQWVRGPNSATVPLSGSPASLTLAPTTFGTAAQSTQFTAKVAVTNLAATPPTFATPVSLPGAPSSWSWSARYGFVAGDVSASRHYTENVAQPDPSTDSLEASAAVRSGGFVNGPGASVLRDNLSVDNIPAVVSQLVTKITAGLSTPYDKARALSTYFTNPANGFIYSLETKAGESGSDLVDFLTTGKAGFCQQYAASLGVMLRVAGIPARVVLGYTHPAPDASGHFEVTSDDAHAWVEAYFTGIGWLPFDPTPLVGADAARAVAIPWAPHPQVTGGTALQVNPRAGEANAPVEANNNGQGLGNTSGTDASAGVLAVWAGAAALGLLALIALLLPGLLRLRRRRSRLRQARTAGPEPLWDELRDTAIDLGLGWSPARSARQVTSWLGEHVSNDAARGALARLAAALERQRYAVSTGRRGSAWTDPGQGPSSIHELALIRRELLHSVPGRRRWRARLWPASLRRSATQRAGGTSADRPATLVG